VALRVDTAAAKAIVLDKIAAGSKVREAMASVGRSEETYRDWKKSDPDFKAQLARRRDAVRDGSKAGADVGDFPDFCATYLHKPLPLHHLRAWDVLCGREPRELHDAMQFIRGSGENTMILNFPPDHAKSTVWNVEYVVYRICQDPNIRIITISKNEGMARKFLGQVKFYLQNANLFPELHAAFAPEGGWRSDDKGDGLLWRENMIYVRGRTESEKDPTLEARGLNGQIYGARADLIILDDIEDKASASAYEAHAAWIGQDVYSRLDKQHGMLLILGTRVGVVDIYRWLRDEAKDEFDEPFYTYFAQPAILDGETGPSADWVVLWPERMPPRAIAKAKAAMTDKRRFTFVYQQRDVAFDQTFPDAAVDASVNQRRFNGPLTAGAPGHTPRGMEGMYVIAGLDPATAGHTAAVVIAIDRLTKRRIVLDCYDRAGTNSERLINLIKDWTVKFGIQEWRIERNAFQRFLTQLPELKLFLTGRGVQLREHYTSGKNKFDADFGVDTLAPLFLTCVEPNADGRLIPRPDGAGLIELPSTRQSPATRELVNQLKAWEPELPKSAKTDLVMALWFAELGIRQYLQGASGGRTHQGGKFTSRRDVKRRGSFTFDQLLQQGQVHAA